MPIKPKTFERTELLARLGLSPDTSDGEIHKTCHELSSFLAPERVPERLRVWAAGEREAASRLSTRIEPAANAPASASGGRARLPNLPDFLEEELAAERLHSQPRRTAASVRQTNARPKPVARRAGSRSRLWRGALLVVTLGVILGILLIGSPLLSGQQEDAGDHTATGQATPIALDQDRVEQLTRTVTANPNDAAALFELGEMHFQAEKWQESIDWFNRLLAVDPTDNHARTDVGTASYNLGRYDDAKAAWQEVARRDPADAQIHFNLGFLLAFGPNRDLDQARAEWQKAIDLDPSSTVGQTARSYLEAID